MAVTYSRNNIGTPRFKKPWNGKKQDLERLDFGHGEVRSTLA